MNSSDIYTIYLHSVSYTDDEIVDQKLPDAWATRCWEVYVQVQTPDDQQQPFDVRGSREFPHRVAALAHAEYLAKIIHGDRAAYQEY